MNNDYSAGKIQFLEIIFLRIFRYVVVLAMALGILMTAVYLLKGLINFSATPQKPMPEKKFTEKKIEDGIDGLLKSLKPVKETDSKDKGEAQKTEVKKVDVVLFKYQTQSNKAYQCLLTFNAKAKIEVKNDPGLQQKVAENFRAWVEKTADNPRFERGEKWVNSLEAFVCGLPNNDKVLKFKIDNPDIAIADALFLHHINGWDENIRAAKNHEKSEERRIARERANAEAEANAKKIQGTTDLIFSASAFGIFMFLAMYLIFAKIESNLLSINSAINSFSSSGDKK